MRIDQFGAQDTSIEAEERVFEELRKLTPAERVQIVFNQMEFMRQVRIAMAEKRGQVEPIDHDKSPC